MKTDHVLLYRAADGWRWRFVRKNGRTLADSGEAYQRPGAAEKSARHVTGDLVPVVREGQA
jgi:uncharacterized protein YegP (UPF0339 family)